MGTPLHYAVQGEVTRKWCTALVAGKFLLYSLEGMSDEERVALVGEAEACGADLASLPLAERWIVSRLHATVDHVTVGPARYCPPRHRHAVRILVS